jgi:3-deoxy-manno-octulosonate cytidylyltransferase (CMP-KDO synthetase)
VEFLVIVPARLASTRLPNKPLADIGGAPMVVQVARNAAQSGAARVVVAADDEAIIAACRAHGVDSILTSRQHQSGTDRLAEAARLLALEPRTIVVNVQGDEPLLPPAVIRDVAQLLHARPNCEIATAAHPIVDAIEFFSPDVVKVVIDAESRALMFSRAPIPWSRDAFSAARDQSLPERLPLGLPALRHVGLYAYRAAFLARFPSLPRPTIEEHEKLEQLRALAHGIGIAVLQLAATLPPGVDTADDLQRVRAMIRS